MKDLKSLIVQPALKMPELDKIVSLGQLSEGNLKFFIDGGCFDTFFVKKDSPYLFVFFSGARNPEKSILPHLDRWSWANKFPGSCLYISDPSYYIDPDNLKLAWYVGPENNDYVKSIVKLIRKVSFLLLVDLSKVILYGSSGGGFAALKVLGEMNDGVAISINPQTNILRYTPSHVNNFIKIVYGKLRDEISEKFKDERLSVYSGLARLNKGKFILLQNVQDEFHYINHYLPLCAYLGISPENNRDQLKFYNTWLYDCESGHGPEPKDLVPKLIDVAIKLTSLNFCNINTLPLDRVCEISIRKCDDKNISKAILEKFRHVGDAYKIYKSADNQIDFLSKKIKMEILHKKDLSKSEVNFLMGFHCIEKNLLLFEESNKNWLIKGFVLRYIFYWDYYLSGIFSDSLSFVVDRIYKLNYLILKVQSGKLNLNSYQFNQIETILKKQFSNLFSLARKDGEVDFCLNEVILISKKIVGEDFFNKYYN